MPYQSVISVQNFKNGSVFVQKLSGAICAKLQEIYNELVRDKEYFEKLKNIKLSKDEAIQKAGDAFVTDLTKEKGTIDKTFGLLTEIITLTPAAPFSSILPSVQELSKSLVGAIDGLTKFCMNLHDLKVEKEETIRMITNLKILELIVAFYNQHAIELKDANINQANEALSNRVAECLFVSHVFLISQLQDNQLDYFVKFLIRAIFKPLLSRKDVDYGNPLQLPSLVSPHNENGSVIDRFLFAATPRLLVHGNGGYDYIPDPFFMKGHIKTKSYRVFVNKDYLPIVELFYQAPWVTTTTDKLVLHSGADTLTQNWGSTNMSCIKEGYPPVINIQILGSKRLLERVYTSEMEANKLDSWIGKTITDSKKKNAVAEQSKILMDNIHGIEKMLKDEPEYASSAPSSTSASNSSSTSNVAVSQDKQHQHAHHTKSASLFGGQKSLLMKQVLTHVDDGYESPTDATDDAKKTRLEEELKKVKRCQNVMTMFAACVQYRRQDLEDRLGEINKASLSASVKK